MSDDYLEPIPERLTHADADLLAHDARKPKHPHPSACEVDDCWVPACRAWRWSEHLQAVAE